MIKEFGGNSYLFGTNAAFVEELYDSYLVLWTPTFHEFEIPVI